MTETCACADFRAPVRTWPDVLARAEQRSRIAWTLEKLAEAVSFVELHRCRVCGQLWQSGEDRSGELIVLFQVSAVDVDTWRTKPFRDVIDDAATRPWLLGALEKGEEVGPEECSTDGCKRLHIAYGIFCRKHHVESLQRSGQLPPWPPEEF